jgi:site-specific recombinase XerD
LKAHNISAPTEEQLALPKRVYSPQIPPSVDAVNRAIDAEKSVKIRAILELLYGSALRSKEVRTLRIEQIDLLGRTAKIDAGRGMRIVVLTKPAVEWLTLQIGSREIGLVFPPNRPAEIMATGTLCRMVREAGQRVGVKLHPHLLRHACAVHMLEQGAPLNCIQELLGHARLTTTTLYLAMDIAHLIRVHSACHPHGDGGTRPAMRDW